MRRGILGMVPIAALAAWVIVSCLEPTEINVQLRTNFACANVDVILLVGGSDVTTKKEPPFTATTSTCKSSSEIGNIHVVPSGKMGSVYVRVVTGVLGSKAVDCLDPAHPKTVQCIEARRTLRFVPHRKLDLPITLDEACINKDCPAGQTCDRGQCINADVCTENCDAGPEAGPDADMDTGVDSGQPPQALLLAAGWDNACVFADNKKLYCWGDNSNFQLGTQKSVVGAIPVDLGLGSITEIAVGNHFICATDGSAVHCLGKGSAGQLGNGSSPDSETPVTALDSSQFDSLRAGDTFACVHSPSTKEVLCWGTDATGRNNEPPSSLGGDPGFTQIALGSQHGCGIDPSAIVWCWGSNIYGETGLDPDAVGLSKTPVSIYQAGKVGGFYAGHRHSGITHGPALMKKTYAWGDNRFGEIDPTNPNPKIYVPTNVGRASDDLAFGEGHVCAIQLGQLNCRGDNSDGQVSGTPGGVSKAWTPPLADTVQYVAAGSRATCAITAANKVWCWGMAPVGPPKASPTEIVLPP